jgi:hypothetical protein
MDIIKELRATQKTFNSPASEEKISALQTGFSSALPDAIVSLYRDHDGMPLQRGRGLRLMPVEEALELFATTGNELGCLEKGIRCFWTDDNSNYAGVYATGPLKGKVCFLDHESPDYAPAFRSVESFLEELLHAIKSGHDWYEMTADYPSTNEAKPQEVIEDWELVKSIRPNYEHAANDDQRAYWAMCIMALTPPAHTATLMEFLDVDDIWIPERACQILGSRKFEPAIEKFVALARAGKANSGIASLMALGKVGTLQCRELLISLAGELRPGVSIYIAKALEECGCEVGHTDGNWRYRLPESDKWVQL